MIFGKTIRQKNEEIEKQSKLKEKKIETKFNAFAKKLNSKVTYKEGYSWHFAILPVTLSDLNLNGKKAWLQYVLKIEYESPLNKQMLGSNICEVYYLP